MKKLALLLAVTLIAGCSAGVPTEPRKAAPSAIQKDETGDPNCPSTTPVFPYIYPCQTQDGRSGFTLSSG